LNPKPKLFENELRCRPRGRKSKGSPITTPNDSVFSTVSLHCTGHGVKWFPRGMPPPPPPPPPPPTFFFAGDDNLGIDPPEPPPPRKAVEINPQHRTVPVRLVRLFPGSSLPAFSCGALHLASRAPGWFVADPNGSGRRRVVCRRTLRRTIGVMEAADILVNFLPLFNV